jgi:hypothetical protein
MMVGGGIMITLGVAAAVTSIVFFSQSAGCRGDFCGFNTAFGAGFAGLGVLLLGAGIPVAVVGAAKVTPKSSAVTRPALHLGPGTATFEWQF